MPEQLPVFPRSPSRKTPAGDSRYTAETRVDDVYPPVDRMGPGFVAGFCAAPLVPSVPHAVPHGVHSVSFQYRSTASGMESCRGHDDDFSTAVV